MTKPAGTRETTPEGKSRLWVRCPICGDSKRRPWVAHAVVDLDRGSFHCHRCGHSSSWIEGFVPKWEKSPLKETEIPEEWQPIPGPATARFSALARYHLGGDELFRSSSGGWLRITPDRRRFAQGPLRQGLGIPKFRSIPLVSSPASPIVVVEGPWDVLDAFSDVCLFGALPTRAQLLLLRGQFLVLRPDHDVLAPGSLLRDPFVRVWSASQSIVVGVDLIPGDPDDLANSSDLRRIPLSSLRRINDAMPPDLTRGGTSGLWKDDPDPGPDEPTS